MSNPNYEKRYTKVFLLTITSEEAPHDFYADCDVEISIKAVIMHLTTDAVYFYMGYGETATQAYEDALETKRTHVGEMYRFTKKMLNGSNFWLLDEEADYE